MSKLHEKCDRCKRDFKCCLDGNFRRECIKRNYKWFLPIDKVEESLLELAASVEPKTHCCECTPGPHFQIHMVHIQYPDCDCDPKNYVLRRNGVE